MHSWSGRGDGLQLRDSRQHHTAGEQSLLLLCGGQLQPLDLLSQGLGPMFESPKPQFSHLPTGKTMEEGEAMVHRIERDQGRAAGADRLSGALFSLLIGSTKPQPLLAY